MRRLISLVAVSLVMAAMVLASVVPAFAVPPPEPPPQSVYHQGQYYCYKYDPATGTYLEQPNVPRGQVAAYQAEGWFCYSQRF